MKIADMHDSRLRKPLLFAVLLLSTSYLLGDWDLFGYLFPALVFAFAVSIGRSSCCRRAKNEEDDLYV